MLFGQAEKSATSSDLLRPENCVDSSRIRAFLRLSRIATDDTIRQHLNEIGRGQCDEFFKTKIAPQWKARAEAIQYCSEYAVQLHQKSSNLPDGTVIYDYRTDPYAFKNVADKIEEQNIKAVTVENWVANELQVESIIREQTASVLNDKCYFSDWLAAFKKVT